jgi:glycosyltransferase involved in cell wall biosynthesis
MKETFFSVIIPTRDRALTLPFTILSVLKQDYKNFELIISDNFSSDDTKKIVENFNDARIRYLNTNRRVSMSDNWEFALNNYNGDWVTIIGDDDALLPNALNKVNVLINLNINIEAIRSETCYYFYPGVNNQQYGRLGVPLINSDYEIRNSQVWLNKVLSGEVNYTELPVLYNGGFISKKLINKTKQFSPKLINSCVPDVYSSMIFSHLINEYLFSFEAFAINGASLKSNGMSQFGKNSLDNNSPIKQFQLENNIPFNECIPLYNDGRYPQSILAFVYESYLNCIKILNIKSEINFGKQIENIIIYNYKKDHYFIDWIQKYSEINNVNFRKVYPLSLLKKYFVFIKNIKNKMQNIGKYFEIGDNIFPINNAFEASNISNLILQISKSNFKNLLKFFIKKINFK